jgi:predicted dehydrogenase
LKTGILGAGNFSERVLNLFSRMEGVELVGAYDSIPVGSLMDFSSLEDMMHHCQIVVVLDPISSDPSVLTALAKGGKHIYVESPSLCSRNDLRNLELLAFESDIVFQIGLKQRFYNFYSDLEKYALVPRIIDSNRFLKFNKNSTQLSVVDDLMLHDIDVSLKLSNSDVKSVFATAVGVYYKDPDVVNARIDF